MAQKWSEGNTGTSGPLFRHFIWTNLWFYKYLLIVYNYTVCRLLIVSRIQDSLLLTDIIPNPFLGVRGWITKYNPPNNTNRLNNTCGPKFILMDPLIYYSVDIILIYYFRYATSSLPEGGLCRFFVCRNYCIVLSGIGWIEHDTHFQPLFYLYPCWEDSPYMILWWSVI